MRSILVLGLLAAALGGASIAMPATAQVICDGPCVITGGGKGGGGDSGEPYSAAEPFNPFGDTRKVVPDGDGAHPSLPGYVAGLKVCRTQLGDLRRVRASSIRAVHHGVSVSQICENKNLTDQQDGVASVRTALKRNKTMIDALHRAGGFVADAVVAVVLDGEGAKLYVHRNEDSASRGRP